MIGGVDVSAATSRATGCLAGESPDGVDESWEASHAPQGNFNKDVSWRFGSWILNT